MTKPQFDKPYLDELFKSYPGLKGLLNELVNRRAVTMPPVSMQFKNKTADMVTAVVMQSRTLVEHQLILLASGILGTLSSEELKMVYHGFFLGNEDDLQNLAHEDAVLRVPFIWGSVPFHYVLIAFFMAIAFNDSPNDLGTRSFLGQIKRWTDTQVCYLANRLTRAIHLIEKK